jgi:RNA polymerase sigma-70 factor
MATSGNSQARAVFEILLRENQAMLMTYLRTMVHDESLADDLFQETMLITWKRLDEYDRSRPLGPWLRGIAAKLVLAHFRKAKSDLMAIDEEMLDYLGSQLQHISERPGDTWDEKVSALTHCIEALSTDHKQAIQLRYFQQQPTSRIAALAEASVETIKKRLQRARSELLDCLRRKKVVAEISE